MTIVNANDNGATSAAAINDKFDSVDATIAAIPSTMEHVATGTGTSGSGLNDPKFGGYIQSATSQDNFLRIYDKDWIDVYRQASPIVGDTYDQYGIRSLVSQVTGSNRIVPGSFHGVGSGTHDGQVWGLVTETWCGTGGEDPTFARTLVGAEFAIISQYHNNTLPLVGVDIVIKNRMDGATHPVHNALGSNNYTNLSYAIQIGGQGRSTDIGEYCGWGTGIYFSQKAFDRSASSGDCTAFDFQACSVDNEGNAIWLARWFGGGKTHGIRFNPANQYFEFVSDIYGTPVRAGYVNMATPVDHAL